MRFIVIVACGFLSMQLYAQSWNNLNSDEQELLAPLYNTWPQLSPALKQKALQRAKQLEQLTPAQQQQLQQRIQAFNELSAEERALLINKFKAYKTLPPEQRQNLQAEWQQLSPEAKAFILQN